MQRSYKEYIDLCEKSLLANYKKDLQQLWLDIASTNEQFFNITPTDTTIKHLYDALRNLPRFCYEVCLLYYIGHFSLHKIARLSKKSEHLLQQYLSISLHLLGLYLSDPPINENES